MAKVITLRQPWAGLLVMGLKKFETRSWATAHRGRIYVHASAKIDAVGKHLIEDLQKYDKRFEIGSIIRKACMETGKIIGHVDIVDVHSTDEPLKPEITGSEYRFGDYSPGRHYWETTNARRLFRPIPAKGQLSIWNIDDEILNRNNGRR